MFRRLSVFVLAALSSVALTASAHEMDMSGGQKPTTVRGEVVDTGCYLAHGAKGESHVSCATKCINKGMPMGLLTSQGKLYLLTLNHDNADPYNKIKAMAGKTVDITGVVSERAGVKGIEVTDFKPVATAAAK